MIVARTNTRSRGFTLLELLVAIGIIMLLVSLALPMILISFKKAARTRAAADMATIGVALDAYKADFGDYPRPGTIVNPPADFGKPELNDGFAVLGRALLSPGGVWQGNPPVPSAPVYNASNAYDPGQCVGSGINEYLCFKHADAGVSPPAPAFWMPFVYSDGSPGPGFRARPGGKVYPAYLAPEKFKTNGVAILDYYGNPILYFIAPPRRQNISENNWMYVNDSKKPSDPYYDVAQNIEFFIRPSDSAVRAVGVQRMEAFMIKNVDPNNLDGKIRAPEVPMTMNPYILWSAGGDDSYGVDEDSEFKKITKRSIDKCDDVVNFER